MFDAVRVLSAESKYKIYFLDPFGLYFRRSGVRFRCQSSSSVQVSSARVNYCPAAAQNSRYSTHFRPQSPPLRDVNVGDVEAAGAVLQAAGTRARSFQGGPSGQHVPHVNTPFFKCPKFTIDLEKINLKFKKSVI